MAESEFNTIMAELKTLQLITAISAKSVLTDNEAAIYTGYTADHLYRKAKDGDLARIKQGRSVRYIKADLDEWMMRDRITPKSEIEDRANKYLLSKSRAAKM